MNVIGLDIGHSAVKVAAGGESIVFPTAAAAAMDLAVGEAAAAAKEDTAVVNGKPYFVGKTALIHTNGQLVDGLRDDWIESDEHTALLVSGFQRGIKALGDPEPLVVLGLPSRLHGRQHARLVELAVMHLGLPKQNIRVLPQPLGAYMAAVLDETGEPVEGRRPELERWGIIDIGYYTADFGLIEAGVWSAAGAKSVGGANMIATDLRDRIYAEHGVNIPLREADDILRTKSAKVFGKAVDLGELVEECSRSYARTIIDNASQVFGERLPMFDGMLIAGGAASLLYPHFVKAWPHAVTAATPRFTVAEGMRRYGLLQGGAPGKKAQPSKKAATAA